MPINFYYIPESAPCRSVQLAANALGVELTLKHTSLMAGDHLKPEFIKLNPQHTIPTLDDNGFVLWESRAIMGYLVQQYGKDDSLYPKNPKKRAIVDARLYFDMGTLYKAFAAYYYPVLMAGAPYDQDKLAKLEEAYFFLDKFLEGQAWIAGDNMTIADMAIVASVSTADIVGFNVNKYPNVAKWYAKAKVTMPGYDEVTQPGINGFKKWMDKTKQEK